MWKKLGRIVSAPVRVPVNLAKKGVDKVMDAATLGIIRHVLTALGGYLVARGYLSESDVPEAVGAAITVGVMVWSYLKNRRAKAAIQVALAMPQGSSEADLKAAMK